MLKDTLMVWKEGLDCQRWIKFLYFFSVALGIKSGTSCILYYWVTSTALGVCFSLGTYGLFACLLSYLFLFSGDRVSLCCSGWSNSYIRSRQQYSPKWLWIQVCGTTAGSLSFSVLNSREEYHAAQSLCSGLGEVIYGERQNESLGQALLWAPYFISASEGGCINVFRGAKECEQFTNERVESSGRPGLSS